VVDIAPSMLGADFGRMREAAEMVGPHSAYLHMDVMDGHFVPNLTMGPDLVKSLDGIAPLDVHLMVTDMKGGAFVIVAGVGAAGLGYSLDSYKGLAARSQLLALSMTVCLLSLVGIPPFAGFISKFLLFYGTLQAGLSGDTWIIALVIAGVLNSALSLYYYLKVIRFMYLYDAVDSKDIEFSNAVRYISFLTVLFLAIILPLFWQSLFERFTTQKACQ